MKFDNDSKERARVFLSFLLEAYKICMGCFLTVFVAHNCPSLGGGSVMASFRPQTHAGMIAIVVNGATFGAICTLYGVELLRRELRHHPPRHRPDLPRPPPRRGRLRQRAAPVVGVEQPVLEGRVGVHGLGGRQHCGLGLVPGRQLPRPGDGYFDGLVLDLGPDETVAFISMARQDRTTVRARSAYMTEYTSFNVLDEDHYPRKDAKDALSLEDELGCDDIVLEEEV